MKNQDRRKDENLEDYFFRMLIIDEINFPQLINKYVLYLELKNKENWKDIVEASTLVMATKGAIKKAGKRDILWAGDRNSLIKRCIDFLNKHKVFNEVKSI